MPAVRTRTGLALMSTLLCVPACRSDAEHEQAGPAIEPGLGPRTPSEPERVEAAPEVEAPAPEVEVPEPEPDPVLAERKQALAEVGRSAFEALQAGEFEALIALTPLAEGPLREACPRMPIAKRRELEARFSHCHETIRWDAVAEAQVFAGTPSGDPAGGCEDGIEDYGRLQMFLHMNDETIWRVDFFGAVGQDGKAVGINGEVACREVDEAPELK